MIKRRRLIALFDILGFSSRLKNEQLGDLRRQLRNLIRAIRSEALTANDSNHASEDDDNLETACFVFDSIVLISFDLSDSHSARKFVYACVALLELGFVHNLPFRGSITLGDVFTDGETGLILSDQLPELRDGEQMQDWTGCFVHPEAVDSIFLGLGEDSKDPMLNKPTASHVMHWREVPVKDSFSKFSPLFAWCLNWVQMLDFRHIVDGLEYLKGDKNKYDFTKNYIEYVCSLDRRMTPLLGGGIPEGTKVKTLQSGGVIRMKVVDANGNLQPIQGQIQYTIINEEDQSETGTCSLPLVISYLSLDL